MPKINLRTRQAEKAGTYPRSSSGKPLRYHVPLSGAYFDALTATGWIRPPLRCDRRYRRVGRRAWSGYELTYSTLDLPTRAVPRDATPFGNCLTSQGCLLESPRFHGILQRITREPLPLVRPFSLSFMETVIAIFLSNDARFNINIQRNT